MPAVLFRGVLSASIRMAFPLAVALLLIPLGRKHIRPRTLFCIEKFMIAGMLLALALTVFGPLVRIPVSNQAPVQQFTPVLPPLAEQMINPTEAVVRGAVSPTPVTVWSVWDFAGYFWFCGAGLLFFFTLVQNLRFFHRIRKDSAPAPSVLENLCADCSRMIGLRVPPAVRIVPAASSPMAAGYFCPTIFLPARMLYFSPEQQRLLLSHELYHCKTGDNFWRLFSSVALAIFWFNPLVWVLIRSFSTQCELCCDENVLSGASVQTRKLYGNLLLLFSAGESKRSQPTLSLQSGWRDTFHSMKLRIGQIVSFERKKAGRIFLMGNALILLIFSGVIGFRQVYAYSPSPVIILPENPMGFTEGDECVPKETFVIQAPIDTDQALHFSLTNMDDSIQVTQLHFMANKKNEVVTAGCYGVVAAVQTKGISEPGRDESIPTQLGKCVIVDCGNGISIRYTYLDTVLVEEGQTVSTGDILGTAGNTGASFGKADQCGVFVMQDGLMVDPLPFFNVSVQPAVYS